MGYSNHARKTLALLLLLSAACLLAAPVVEAAAANPPGWFIVEPGADRQFLSMSAGDRNTVWAVSYDYKLFKSEDGGAHWGIQNPVTDLYRVLDVSAVNGSVAWVLGFWSDSTGSFLNLTRTSDGGATWSTGADMGLPSGYAPRNPEND